MKRYKWKLVVIAVALILPVFQASAGWMDKVSNALDETDNGKPSSSAVPSIASLSHSDIAAGLKDALRIGSENVVGQLGKSDGFNADPEIHIPLPENLQAVKSTLSTVGMGGMMEDLELKLNHAAEAATPKAKRIFGDAIQAMTIDDAKNILNGPKDAATQYFKSKMSKPLSDEMRPVVTKALSQAGAVKAYNAAMGEYGSLPFVPNVKANLTQHVLDLGLAGIFHYLAKEEASIRMNPAKRTTDLLQRVFGNK